MSALNCAQGRWAPHFGAGLRFEFLNASLQRSDWNVSFDDLDCDTG